MKALMITIFVMLCAIGIPAFAAFIVGNVLYNNLQECAIPIKDPDSVE